VLGSRRVAAGVRERRGVDGASGRQAAWPRRSKSVGASLLLCSRDEHDDAPFCPDDRSAAMPG